MLLTVIGARPQFIKAAPMSAALLAAGVEEKILHTGQHYDQNMSQSFFDDLGIPVPIHNLAVGSGSHGQQTSVMLTGIERICLELCPQAMLVFGDTNSTLAAALAAAKLGIPIAHVEAGLRSFNRQMPEEINRVLTDHLSRWLFCPTENAAHNLSREGIDHAEVHVVGDIMYDILLQTQAGIGDTPSPARANGVTSRYIAATIHRQENTDNLENLREIINGFQQIELPVILPMHPRTRKVLKQLQYTPEQLKEQGGLHIIEPLSYPEMVKLSAEAEAIFTDSGGLQKEAYWLKTPCFTIRDQTEWVETLELGWNQLMPANAGAIAAAANSIKRPHRHPPVYGNGHTATRIADILRISLLK